MIYQHKISYFSRKCLSTSFILLFITFGCQEDLTLQEKPLDFITPTNAYTSEDGIKQGINGLFATVRTDWYYGHYELATPLKGLGTDVAFHGEDPNSTLFLCNYSTTVTPTWSAVSRAWRNSYAIVQRANVLIESINVSDDKIWGSDVEKKNVYLAEAKFFRAFAYRILVSLWGDVPLVTEVISGAKIDYVRAPKEDVYKLIEEDLTYAAINLPVPGSESDAGRITQGAALQLLSEMYLAQSKFQLAVDATSKIINDYGYALMTERFGTQLGNDVFGSGDVYYDLFVMGNQNLAENTEAILVIQVEPIVTGGGSVEGGRTFGPAYFRLGNTPDGYPAFQGEFYNGQYTGYSDTLGRPVAWMRPTNYLAYDIWKSDWDQDIRNAKHSIKRNFYFDNPNSIYDKKRIDFTNYQAGTRDAIRDTCQYIFPFFLKSASPMLIYANPATSGNGSHHKDLYAMRLAETYLLRAEAYLGLDMKGLAAADINKIRSRANATPVSVEEVDIDYLLDERARELYTEEWRYITLLRMGKLVERVRTYNNNPLVPGGNIKDYHKLWPIPQTEIDLNINAVIEQNPGY